MLKNLIESIYWRLFFLKWLIIYPHRDHYILKPNKHGRSDPVVFTLFSISGNRASWILPISDFRQGCL